MGERRGTKALETWCRRVTQGYPGVKVENMTTSWRDGLAFCAMIHHFRPDLIDFSRLEKSDIYGNNELAFRIAERHLGIPALLDAEDMAEYPVPDRLSILTYLSQFYQAFASNSSSPIKKSSSDSPDDSLVTLVQGNVQQSTKMEEGSSLPRREPCVICNNPVFIAQKLRIDGKLYHRTCFRCARCGTQLSLADYYETHDGQYCCETCPDEIIMQTTKTTKLRKEIEGEQQLQEVPQLDDGVLQDDLIKQTTLYDRKIKSLPPEPPPAPSTVVNKDPATSYHVDDITSTAAAPSKSPSASLVAIRRMMFDTYNKHTDDAKLIINKKDLSHNVDSSSHKIKSNSGDKIVVNNNKNSISNNNSNKISSSCNNEDKQGDEEDIVINSKELTSEDTHQFSEIIISNKTDLSGNDLVDNANKQLGDNMYKTDYEDKSLPLRKYSATQIDSVQVSSMSNDQLIKQTLLAQEEQAMEGKEMKLEEMDVESYLAHKKTEELLKNEGKKQEESLGLHTEDVINDTSVENEPTLDDYKKQDTVKPQQTDSNTVATQIPTLTTTTISIEYPDDLNPFGDDDDNVTQEKVESPKKSTNPFGSDSEENEEADVDQQQRKTSDNSSAENRNQNESVIHKSPSLNPFDSDGDEEEYVKKPVPLPRNDALSSEPVPFPRNRLRGSLRSINSLSSTYSLPSPRKKKPAPHPPSSACSTLSRSPRPRKTRRAPLPPASSTIQSPMSASSSAIVNISTDILANDDRKLEENEASKSEIAQKISTIVDLITDMAANTKEEKTEVETVTEKQKQSLIVETNLEVTNKDPIRTSDETGLLRIESEELEDSKKMKREVIVTPQMRRNSTQCDVQLAIQVTIQESGPRSLNESIGGISSGNLSSISDNSASFNISYCESLSSPPSEKKNKDSVNLHRKISESGSVYLPKSSHGQWRRKKAPAPSLPLPKRRPVQPMPIQNIRQELHDIEIKQQGLERQGVALENKIRDKFDSESTITPYVEELVLQLFELVNEKNELFRKQAELMYLRRQHQLEEEHAELEFRIRCLMARPEANKTDSDKELEEQLIQRLVEVVERRDAIVQCLEMDRIREAEEDRSIHKQLGIFTLAMAKEVKLNTKKKHKKNKEKHNVLKMMDLDKDVDDSEKEPKKKKKWFTLHHTKGELL